MSRPVLYFALTILLTTGLTVSAATPDEVVQALYKQHEVKTPFFQTKDRAVLSAFFAKPLSALIWKDAESSKEEPGVIDGDPLFDAQDYEPKNLVIHPAKKVGETATVEVTFTNYGEKKKILFSLIPSGSSWLVTDIRYAKDRTLLGQLQDAYGQ